MTTPPTRRGARHPSERPPVLVRLVQTSDLPDGINALASVDGGTIIVRAGLDKATRRRAVREVLARRFPGLLVFPVMAAMQLRRAVVAVTEGVSRLVQSAVSLITPDSPVVILTAGAAVVTATTVGGAVTTLTGRTPQGAHAPAQAGAPRHPGQAAALAGHGSRSAAGRPHRSPGPVPSPQPGTAPVPSPSGSAPALPAGPVTSPATSLLRSVLPSLPVPVPSVSVSASLPPLPTPSPPPVPSPSPTCVQAGPINACVSP
jgi:hypothetical protein